VTVLLAAGAAEYIVKPIDRPVVIKKLSAFVKRFELKK
jgi:AmiR/NasT family two-component response regulator